MSTPIRRLPTALAACALLLAPVTGRGDSAWVRQGGASASLDFRVVIPPVMRVLENSHPDQLDPSAHGEASAEQRLVVLSNLKHGFCVSLRQAAPQLGTWALQTAPQSGMQLHAMADGYRLCSTRAGQYTVRLQHRFDGIGSGQGSVHWPVRTEISAI